MGDASPRPVGLPCTAATPSPGEYAKRSHLRRALSPLAVAKQLAANPDRPFAAAQGDNCDASIGGISWEPVGEVYCPCMSLTARKRAILPSPVGDYESHPYGLSCLSSWLRMMPIKVAPTGVYRDAIASVLDRYTDIRKIVCKNSSIFDTTML
jgi:hypothetical protein